MPCGATPSGPALGTCSASGACKLPAGATCATADNCQSGYCVANVCCSEPCDAACGECSTGTCRPCGVTGGVVNPACPPVLPLCPSVAVDCTTRLKGMVGADCLRYTEALSSVSVCVGTRCANSSSFEACDLLGAATASAIEGGACPDQRCVYNCPTLGLYKSLLPRTSVWLVMSKTTCCFVCLFVCLFV